MQKYSTKDFIEKARKVHGDKYDYSKVEYVNNKTKVCIICPKHGEFWQRPSNHTNLKQGCPKCANKNITTKDFIEKSLVVHGNKYDYSKVEYMDAHHKVCIICRKHGEFWQIPNDHLNGCGCYACGVEKTHKHSNKGNNKFISESIKIHGDKYDYSKINYKNIDTKVCIICRKHGEFWQTPYKHLIGQGCPCCKTSKLENEIKNILLNEQIEYEYQKRFKWLGKQTLDFYLPQYKIAIECQGIQHFEQVKYFGGEETLKITKVRDLLKKDLCKENGIKLLYYSNLGIEYPYKVFENKEELLKEIIEK